MSTPPQAKKIKCPHCGWKRTVQVDVIAEASQTSVVRGVGDQVKVIISKVSDVFKDPLDEANTWLDQPPCANCQKPYRYNIRTGETSP